MRSIHAFFYAVLVWTTTVAGAAAGEATTALERFASYRQGEPLSHLTAARQTIFDGIGDEVVRARRENMLLTFIQSGAHVEAKAIAIEWLGILGSETSVPVLTAALEDPTLAAPAAGALARISGAEASSFRSAEGSQPLPAVASAAAEVARFHDEIAEDAADEVLAVALASPNDLLAVAALRQIRAGKGSPSLPQSLLADMELIPESRHPALLDALATRNEAEALVAVRAVLEERARSGDIEAMHTLGRILRPEDMPMLLEAAAAKSNPDLAAAAQAGIHRATAPGINAALAQMAREGTHAATAVAALAARQATDTVETLWQLTKADDDTTSEAAWDGLGEILPAGEIPALIERAAAASETPYADQYARLIWHVLRRHPDPAAAAILVEEAAAAVAQPLRDVLARHAERIRPQSPQVPNGFDLPEKDDSHLLAPDYHRRVLSLNSGAFSEARADGYRIRRLAGEPWQFGDIAHALATVDYGEEIRYEITGLDAGADYVLAISAWDADQSGRRQAITVNGRALLPDFAPIGYHANQPTYIRVHLPLARDLTIGGSATVAVQSLAGPNAVISEVSLLRRAADAVEDVKRVVIITGDDYPGHHWRVTGPEFARILRPCSNLEITITESPAILGSSAIAHYDAVFIHFKNYNNRLPTSEEVWKNLENYIRGGGGMVVAHFGCGAMQEWNGFVDVAGRVWDPNLPGHDPYGEFVVRVLDTGHPATHGLRDFITTDELYTCLAGDTEIKILADATSKVDGHDHPMAFVLTPGKGRVFHSPLGHDLQSLQPDGTRQLYLQGTRWAAGLTNDHEL